MASIQRAPAHSTSSTTVADLLERVLDKGVVIAGDIKVSLVDIELLSIQIRLVICSVDKAKEMGMDWWVNHPVFSAQKPREVIDQESTLARLEKRLASIEENLQRPSAAALVEPAVAERPPAAAMPIPAAASPAPAWAKPLPS